MGTTFSIPRGAPKAPQGYGDYADKLGLPFTTVAGMCIGFAGFNVIPGDSDSNYARGYRADQRIRKILLKEEDGQEKKTTKSASCNNGTLREEC